MSAPLTSDQVNYLIWRYLQESGFAQSTFSFQEDSRANYLEERFKGHVQQGALIRILQKGLQYLALESSICESGNAKANHPYSYFGPVRGVQDAAHDFRVAKEDPQGDVDMVITPPPSSEVNGGNGIAMEEDSKAEFLLREPAHTNGTVTPVKRGHDGNAIGAAIAGLDLNGVLGTSSVGGQRNKRAKTASAAVATEGDAMVIDGIGLPDTTSEEVRATIGASVGTQLDAGIQIDSSSPNVIHLSLNDPSADSSAVVCEFFPGEKERGILAVALDSNTAIFKVPEDTTTSSADPKPEATELFQKFGDKMSAISWSEAGQHLATASWSGLIKIWDQKGQLRRSLDFHRAPILVLKFHPKNHNLLISVDGHNRIMVWDVAAGKPKKALGLTPAATNTEKTVTPCDAEWLCGLSNPNGEDSVVVVGDKGAVEKFDLNLSPAAPTSLQQMGGTLRFEGHDGHKKVSIVSWSSGREVFVTGGEDGKVIMWKPTQSKPFATLDGHRGEISDVKWSTGSTKKDSLLASASADGTVRIWDVDNKIPLHTLDMQRSVGCLSFTPDGKFLAAGTENFSVYIVQTETGQAVGTYTGLNASATTAPTNGNTNGTVESGGTTDALSWDGEGRKLAVAMTDRKCAVIQWGKLWDETSSSRR